MFSERRLTDRRRVAGNQFHAAENWQWPEAEQMKTRLGSARRMTRDESWVADDDEAAVLGTMSVGGARDPLRPISFEEYSLRDVE